MTILLVALFTLAFGVQPAVAIPKDIPINRATPVKTSRPRPNRKLTISLQVRLADHSANIWVYGAQFIDPRINAKYTMSSVSCSSATVCNLKFTKLPFNKKLNLEICYYDMVTPTILGVYYKTVTPQKTLSFAVPKGPTAVTSCPNYSGPINPHP
jgi:hypothetical protein